jgi:hypothetical protein
MPSRKASKLILFSECFVFSLIPWVGFNMENTLAVFITWGAFLVDGNPLTNLLSIGQKTPETGQSPSPPAIVGGLDTHGVFEGECEHLKPLMWKCSFPLDPIKGMRARLVGMPTSETTIVSMKPISRR